MVSNKLLKRVTILLSWMMDFKIRIKKFKYYLFQSTSINRWDDYTCWTTQREFSALNLAEIVLINGNKDEYFEEKILTVNNKIKIFYSQYVPTNLDHFKGKKLIAIAGIGNPNNFFQLVEENGLKLKKLIYPDHYIFNDTDVQEIKNKIAKKITK